MRPFLLVPETALGYELGFLKCLRSQVRLLKLLVLNIHRRSARNWNKHQIPFEAEATASSPLT